jgi:hypothetical protein
MISLAFPLFPLAGLIVTLRRSRGVAAVEAVAAALTALLTGPSGIDPAVGFRR